MLRLTFLGLLIMLGVGVLSAMELNAPPRSTAAVVQPPAGPDTPAANDTLAKADRLDVVAVNDATPTQAALAEEPAAPPENSRIVSPEPPKPIARPRQNAKTAAAAPRPKPKPKAITVKRTAVAERSKPAGDTLSCRLEAFGGLRKALGLAGCEI